MSTYRQVKRITLFELSRDGMTPLLSFVFALALFVVFASEPSFNQSIIMDIVFLSLFSGSFTLFTRSASLKPYMQEHNISMAYSVIFLQQLPVNHRSIIHSRIIIHNIYNIFMQICFIVPLYVFSPVFRETMSIPTFIVYVILWMSIGVFGSGFTAADDAGKSWGTQDRSARTWLIIQLSLIIGSLFVLYSYTPHTLISGSIHFAQNWPIFTLLAAMFIAMSGILYGRRKMKCILETTDYM